MAQAAPQAKRPAARRPAPRGRRRVRQSRAPRLRILLALAALGAVAIWILSAVIARAVAPGSNTSLSHFDAVIVLGSPIDADGNPRPEMLQRVTEAVHEYNRGVAPRLIVTGGGPPGQPTEARVMARIAEAQGVPASAVYQEGEANDTIQNACYSARLMQAHGWQSAEVVSSGSHLPRVGLVLRRFPFRWRAHAAPALVPLTPWSNREDTAMEILKTMRYILYANWTDRCSP